MVHYRNIRVSSCGNYDDIHVSMVCTYHRFGVYHSNVHTVSPTKYMHGSVVCFVVGFIISSSISTHIFQFVTLVLYLLKYDYPQVEQYNPKRHGLDISISYPMGFKLYSKFMDYTVPVVLLTIITRMQHSLEKVLPILFSSINTLIYVYPFHLPYFQILIILRGLY